MQSPFLGLSAKVSAIRRRPSIAFSVRWISTTVKSKRLLWLLPIREEQRPVPEAECTATASQGNGSPFGLLALLYLAMMLSGFNYRALMTALPTYLTAEASGVYLGTGTGVAVLAVFLVGGAGQFFGGRWADRGHAIGLYVSLVALSVPLALLLAWSAGVGPFAVLTAMALATVHFSTQPIENLLIARHTPARLRSTSYGFKFLVTFGVGALGAPVVGLLWRQTGTLAWSFVLFAGVGVVVTGIVLMLVRRMAQ